VSPPKVALLILDGLGIGAGDAHDAVAQARTPFLDSLRATVPNATLRTDGEYVGLPEGQMGNSEVGHLNIGAGRVVYQDLVRVQRAVADGSLEKNANLQSAFASARGSGRRLHLMGLVSDGGVHAHHAHAVALCAMAQRAGVQHILVHAFTDGRDTDPRSAVRYIAELETGLRNAGARIASVVGRYYAMDRDNRWERIRKAYDLLVHGVGTHATSAEEAVSASYAANITDEFIEPFVIAPEGEPPACIREGDVVLCFNFRTDRCREITVALTQKDMPEHGMRTLPLHYVTLTEYDPTYRNVHVLLQKDRLERTLGEVLAAGGKRQLRAAETEKYPHVTFFFSGGREAAFPGEERVLVPSPKVATYDLLPAMSAPELAAQVADRLGPNGPDFVCLNFANPDMVGHTGVFAAIVEAVETTDRCAQQVVRAGLAHGYQFLIIADHGNAEKAVNADGSPNTAHTTNPVPVFLVGAEKDLRLISGKLADVAPTVLDLMHMQAPTEMTGRSLLHR
jgi:2,3-bisphosphoglycerate-independent phosphoglycerate mutase